MSHPWYSIRTLTPVAAAAAGIVAAAAAEVWIYGDIGESYYEETVAAKDFVREIRALDVEAMTVRVASIGGSVPDGLLMYNALREHKATIHISIDSVALSIASLVAMAGDTVAMVENGVFMMHAPWTGVYGNAAQLRATAAQLDVWAAAMATSYATKSGKTLDEIKALLADGTDHYYTAEEAKAAGFVDQLIPAFPVAASAVKPDAVLHRYPSAAGRLTAFTTAAPAARTTQEPTPMPGNTIPPAGGNTPAPTATPNAADILAADKNRRAGVRAQFQLVSARVTDKDALNTLLQQCEDDHDCTPEAASKKILALMGKEAEPIAGGHVSTVEDEGDKRREAIVVALVSRAGLADDKVRAAAQASPFRGHSLLDIARASLTMAGVRHERMDKMQIAAAAFTQTSGDFPALLEGGMHRVLQQAYATAPHTWSRWCKKGSVSDFRLHNRYRTGSLGNLEAVAEGGEFPQKSIPDGEKARIGIGTKGYIITVSRQMVVNDDLGAFIGLSNDMGKAARRTVEVDAYARLAENGGLGPTMADGKPLFHADHKNIGLGSALTVAGLDADAVLLASQTDVSGEEFLDLSPAVLLVPKGLGSAAKVLNGAEYDPDAVNKLQRPNVVRGMFRDIVDTVRLAGTRRYVFADPETAPVMEVAFLDGNDEPFLEQEAGFSVDGTQYKVRLDYGIAAVDFRGAITNAGAA